MTAISEVQITKPASDAPDIRIFFENGTVEGCTIDGLSRRRAESPVLDVSYAFLLAQNPARFMAAMQPLDARLQGQGMCCEINIGPIREQQHTDLRRAFAALQPDSTGVYHITDASRCDISFLPSPQSLTAAS